MLNPPNTRQGDPHPLQGLSTLAGMMLQADGGSLGAERVNVWWDQGDHAQGLASLGRGGVTPMCARVRHTGRVARHWYPDARQGALAGLPVCVQVPLRVGDYPVGLLVLERRQIRASSAATRARVRRFAEQLAHALYRYERENALAQLFRDRDGIEFSGRANMVERVAAYWAHAALTLTPQGYVDGADAAALLCFGARSPEALHGCAVRDLFSGVAWFVFSENRRTPRPHRCTGHRLDGGTFFGLLTMLERTADDGRLRLWLRTFDGDADTPQAPDAPALTRARPALPGPETITSGIQRARSDHGSGWVFARMDVDHLEALQLSHGAPVADAVLEHVLHTLALLVHARDFVGHWHGNTVALGLLEADPAMAPGVLEQLAGALEELPALTPAGRVVVTVTWQWTLDDGAAAASELVSRCSRQNEGEPAASLDSG